MYKLLCWIFFEMVTPKSRLHVFYYKQGNLYYKLIYDGTSIEMVYIIILKIIDKIRDYIITYILKHLLSFQKYIYEKN